MAGRKPPKGGGSGTLSDRELWRLVTSGATPLKGRDRAASPARAPETPSEDPGKTKAKSPSRSSGRLPAARPVSATAARKPPPPDLDHGAIVGLDRRKAERLKRGRVPVEATLDLHGMSQTAAHDALVGFLAVSQTRGRRCVLVITGKGLGKGIGPEAGGILRRQVPLWLNQPPSRERVLAFDYAQPRHGGMGALYVLLKRPRDAAKGERG